MDVENQIRLLKAKQKELDAYYTAEHPAQRSLADQLRYLESERATKQAAIDGLPETQRQLMRFKRAVDTDKQRYDLTAEKLAQLRNEAASITGYATVVDAPDVLPDTQNAAQYIRNILVGFLLGCIGGMALVYARLYSPLANLSNAQQVTAFTDLPILGALPRTTVSSLFKRLLAGRRIATLIEEGKLDPNLLVLMKNIGFATFSAPNPVLMIAGSAPGHAPAVIATNIATMFATLNHTLLIDCSIRERGLHHYFRLPAAPGLSDVLIGKTRLEEAVRPIANNLYFLPGGTTTSYGPQLLRQDVFIALLKQFSASFRHIVLYYPTLPETGPIGEVVHYVGSLAFVIGAGEKRERVRRFLSRYQNQPNAKGIILDDIRAP